MLVGVGVKVSVGVGVGVGVSVDVGVDMGVNVEVGVDVRVGVEVRVGVDVIVGVFVKVEVGTIPCRRICGLSQRALSSFCAPFASTARMNFTDCPARLLKSRSTG